MAYPARIHYRVLEAYEDTCRALRPFLEQLDFEMLAQHNQGYLRYAEDPVFYFLEMEKHKYQFLLNYIFEHFEPSSNVLDIGFFIPVVPVVLAKLGYQVTSIEKMALYDGALRDLVDYVQSTYALRVWDRDVIYDPFKPGEDTFDLVILSAIIEHLNGTPKLLFDRAKSFGKPEAHYIVTVPNVASLEKRLRFFLKGKPPFPPIKDYYDSAYPFSGHNREYSLHDFDYVLRRSGFEPVLLRSYSRRLDSARNWMQKVTNFLSWIGPKTWKSALFADVVEKQQDEDV
jgi:SAM-dependent methyltransferase